MKNVKTITLSIALMLIFGLFAGAGKAYADHHHHRGGSFGLSLPGIGLYIDDHGVSVNGPRIQIDTRNRYHNYRSPHYDPYCPTQRYYSPYQYRYNDRYRYNPQPYPPQYDHRYYDQLRRQRQLQDQIRREQERYQRNMDRIYRDLNRQRDCR